MLGISRRPTRREWRRTIIVSVLLLALLAAFILFVHPSAHLLDVGSPAPPITLPDDKGQDRTAVPSAGHGAVALVFVETGCVTCRQKTDELCRLAEDRPDVSVVAVDSGERSQAEGQRFVRQNLTGCAVTLLLDGDLAVTRNYAVAAVPTAYVVDSSGNISYAAVGAGGIDGLRAHLPSHG